MPEKRDALDKQLKSNDQIKFFISCISGTTSNGHGDDTARPCIAYFICFTKTTDEESVFSLLHDFGFDPHVKQIGSENIEKKKKDEILKEMSIVVKVFHCLNFCNL